MIALVAGLTVASGPERIPGEMKQPLDLRGYWEGTWHQTPDEGVRARLKPGLLRLIGEKGGEEELHCRFVDEGSGKCRMIFSLGMIRREMVCLGIYKWEGSRVIICLGDLDSRQRPTAFLNVENSILITLKPAKPWK